MPAGTYTYTYTYTYTNTYTKWQRKVKQVHSLLRPFLTLDIGTPSLGCKVIDLNRDVLSSGKQSDTTRVATIDARSCTVASQQVSQPVIEVK